MAESDWPKGESHTDKIVDEVEIMQATAPEKRRNEGPFQAENAATCTDNAGLMTKEYSGWDVYNNEAKKVDTELVKDWTASLNSLLLFAAIFSAILTGFIIESKKMLEVNPTDLMVDVMVFYINNVANGTHTPYVRSIFEAESYAVTVNCLFFASLSVSLVAALASVVALQWVADYDAAITRGGSSPEDRAKRRQFRHAGVVGWKMADIIATLPLLLYLSVILFFASLILWMWIVHQTVGLVVSGGAAVAVIFYGSTTFLSVAFVSAPFRTPLSRWIYALIHLPFSLGYLFIRALRAQSPPAWLERWHARYTSSHKRVDTEVGKRSDLGSNALVWLADQISISQDSCHRLLLLVSELPKLDWKHVASREFRDAPWFSIFDLLGWKYLGTDRNTPIDVENARAFEVLIHCGRIPGIHDIIRPSESVPYITDEVQEAYWTQYCGIKRDRCATSSEPNHLFLLLRDAPLFPEYSAKDIEAVIQVCLWRNSSGMDVKEWNKVVDLATACSDHVIRAIIRTFCGFLIAQKSEWYRGHESNCIGVFDRILRCLVDGEFEADTATLGSLIMAFERVITWVKITSTDPRIHHPNLYRRMLDCSSIEARSAHCSLSLLLARNLSSCPDRIVAQQVKTIVAMLWAQPNDSTTDNPARIKEAFFTYLGSKTEEFDVQSMELIQWILFVDRSPRILEILLHLSMAQAKQPQIGSLWRFSTQDVFQGGLFEVLKTFDQMISQGVSPEQHHTLIVLVCQDLELMPPEKPSEFLTACRLQVLEELRDPCFRVLAKIFAAPDTEHIYIPFIDTTGCWERSWGRITKHLMGHHKQATSPSLLRLKAIVWPTIASSGLCEKAAKNLEDLAHLRRIFDHPLPCSQHYDGTGHLLLHVFEHIKSCPFHVNMMEFTTIPMHGRWFNVLLLILALPDLDHEQLRSDDVGNQIGADCLVQLLEICSMVKASRFALLSLLSDLLVKLTGDIGLAAEDVELVSRCVNNALRRPQDTRTISITPLLTLRIGRLRDRMLEIGFRHQEENDIARDGANRAINDLMNHFACMMVFGGRNNRMLFCARTHGAHSPAVGWLAMHVE